jgi:hypothetical protein
LHNPDADGLTLLEGFLERMRARGVQVIMCGVRARLYETMKKAGMAERLGENEIFLEQPVRQTSTLLAVRYAYTLVKNPCPGCPHRASAAPEGDLYYMI